MQIKILDSWLRDYLKTDASPQKIAEVMSLTSVSIERIEKYKNEFVYDIEVTTNRPDLMSVTGLAREAAVALNQQGIHAEFIKSTPRKIKTTEGNKILTLKNDEKLVRRLAAVVMQVTIKDSPEYIKNRLESSDIRSLNNIIDVTNYVMRETGHPTHVFDYDRLIDHKIAIRESKKDERIVTLDEKTYNLPGGDIIATDGEGKIIDLLGIMGLENSVVTNDTKRIVFFIDNLVPHFIRKTSMSLGIRTEAAVLNEKDIDPELVTEALVRGIELYEQIAEGKIISDIIDIYPNRKKEKTIKITTKKIDEVIGIQIPPETAVRILTDLGMSVKKIQDELHVTVPTIRSDDIQIPEDLIEEIARIYGYHAIPTILPPLELNFTNQYATNFFWENRIKEAFKYWGFTEVYTYTMVSENLFEGELSDAVTIQNPLNEEMVYMRKTLVPSLLQVLSENRSRENIKIFELSNVYLKRHRELPEEKLHLAGVIKKPNNSFFEVKGLLEQLTKDMGLKDVRFQTDKQSSTISVLINETKTGEIEILDEQTIDFELDFEILVKNATLQKMYLPIPKYPAIVEDMAFIVPDNINVGEIIETIHKQSSLIKSITLLDKYKDTRTFRITYQDPEKNLSSEDVSPVREKIAKVLKEKLHIHLK